MIEKSLSLLRGMPKILLIFISVYAGALLLQWYFCPTPNHSSPLSIIEHDRAQQEPYIFVISASDGFDTFFEVKESSEEESESSAQANRLTIETPNLVLIFQNFIHSSIIGASFPKKYILYHSLRLYC